MGFLELMLLAVGLSMDALAVSICNGLAMDRVTLGRMVLVGLWFGGFQGLMPLLGWLLGSRFSLYITAIDHWIAFALLAILGINMLREARSGDTEEASASLGFRVMFAMAVATSIAGPGFELCPGPSRWGRTPGAGGGGRLAALLHGPFSGNRHRRGGIPRLFPGPLPHPCPGRDHAGPSAGPGGGCPGGHMDHPLPGCPRLGRALCRLCL